MCSWHSLGVEQLGAGVQTHGLTQGAHLHRQQVCMAREVRQQVCSERGQAAGVHGERGQAAVAACAALAGSAAAHLRVGGGGVGDEGGRHLAVVAQASHCRKEG